MSSHSDEDDEDPYYEETPRELVTTTRSGRQVFRPRHLVVTMPATSSTKIDLQQLEEFDEEHGSDNYEGLSERSEEDESDSDDTGVVTESCDGEDDEADFEMEEPTE